MSTYISISHYYSPSQGGGNAVRAFNLNFGDDEATSVTTSLALGRGAGGEAGYSLDGRKLSGRSAEGRLQGKKPTQRGIYVNKGKKVVIK